MRCCARDEGLAIRSRSAGEAPNHRVLRWLKTVVVSDAEKAHKMRQVGIRKTVRRLEMSSLLKCRYWIRLHRNQIETGVLWEEPGGCPLTGRVVSGM